MGLKKRERPISGLVSTYWLRLSFSWIECSLDRLSLLEHGFSFCQKRAPHALIALQDGGFIAPAHQLNQCGQQLREESTKLSIPAILRPSEAPGIDGEGCQGVAVLVSELSTGIEAPGSIKH
ncbi:MAG: hypothetical protein FNP40_04090 [Dehalobacter sp. 4CP]|nr:hypothetical protein [Dehalobacter sp. 4CP]